MAVGRGHWKAGTAMSAGPTSAAMNRARGCSHWIETWVRKFVCERERTFS